jgi:predicted HicB family RNase H-like nuclease
MPEIRVELDPDTHRALKAKAAGAGLFLKQLILDLIKKAVKP